MTPEAGSRGLALYISPVLCIGRGLVSGASHSTKGLGKMYMHVIKAPLSDQPISGYLEIRYQQT